MSWFAIILLSVQSCLLGLFTFFAFFNYLYGIASLWKSRILRTQISGRKIAVVIVSFNEEFVIKDTVRACDALSYSNKLILLADDSTDPLVVEKHRSLAKSRGCREVKDHSFFQEIKTDNGQLNREPLEIWESPDFVFLHRASNIGFKGGALQKVQEYLRSRNIEFMYLLDADWHPQIDALERTLEVIEAYEDVAFIQTKRIANPKGISLFQKCISLYEEGCYYVDFEGRQKLGHPMLFSGCCTLFKLSAVAEVGGFLPGHLTEDLDLTNRLWLGGWKGKYLTNVVNYGELPFTYDHFRRQQERWAAGTARCLRDHWRPLLKTRQFSWFEKLSALRQNAYFSTTLLTGFGILLAMLTVLWLSLFWNTYAVEYYLYIFTPISTPFLALVYLCFFSNFIEPIIMVIVKKRNFREVLHIPMIVWYAWSVLPTYVVGNVKGLLGIELNWFRTPKFSRTDVIHVAKSPAYVRAFNMLICGLLLFFYFSEGWIFGWFDEFILVLLPAFLIGSMK